MTKNIWPVMPIMMLSAAIASVLTLLLGVHVPAPHGGFLVLPVVDGGIQWVLAILAGTVVGGILFTVFKKHEWTRAQQASEASQAVPAAVERPDVSPEPSDAPAPSADPASEPAEVKDFVSADNVFLGLDLAGRDGALSFVSNEAVKLGIADDADELMAAFLKREDEGSTGMMDGFAIPHAKAATVKRAAVVVVKDDGGIEGWESMDGAPVNVAIALLIPESQAGTTHLKLLSKVAEALMDDEFRSTVKSADDAQEIAGAINARLG